MKGATVIRHARKLRRICEQGTFESMVPDHLPNDPVVVGDLPEFVFVKIGAWSRAGALADALRGYGATKSEIVDAAHTVANQDSLNDLVGPRPTIEDNDRIIEAIEQELDWSLDRDERLVAVAAYREARPL